MDVAGFVAKRAKGDKSATSNTEADADFFATESGGRDKDDGAFDGSAFATMALLPALAPRPRPRRIARRRIVNRKSRLIAMLEAALAKKAATPTPKPDAPKPPSRFIGGRADSRASRQSPRSSPPSSSKPAADFIAFVVGGLSRFSRAPPKKGSGNRTTGKPNDHKIRDDFNHPKPRGPR